MTGPLEGVRVVVTRAAHQAGDLSQCLHEAGAIPIEVPLIEQVEPTDGGASLAQAFAQLHEYEWIVFTSANGVTHSPEFDPVASGLKIAAVGTATQAACRNRDLEVAIVPREHVAEALVDAFPSGTGKVLLPQAEGARSVLRDGLMQKGWTVDAVAAYRTVPVPVENPAIRAIEGADAITFTSSSTVTHYVNSFGIQTPEVVACIGPVTAGTARDAGLRVHVVAGQHTSAGLVAALSAYLSEDN